MEQKKRNGATEKRGNGEKTISPSRYFLAMLLLLFIAITAGCGGGGGGGDGGGTPTPTPTSVNLPKTGQTICYDTAGAVIACANTGQDGELQKGAVSNPRFTVGAGAEALCVTDNLTGLMWVKTPDSDLRTWQAALDYANNLTLCGYTDWRLPNRKELRSLVHTGYNENNCSGSGGYDPCATNAEWLISQGFSNVQASIYWSSSTYARYPTSAWGVYMLGGSVYGDGKTTTYYVWPVRAGQ